MLSNGESGFTEDMGFMEEKDGEKHPWPGFSTFRSTDDGAIELVAQAAFGPGDPYCAVWHMFEILDGGVGKWQPTI